MYDLIRSTMKMHCNFVRYVYISEYDTFQENVQGHLLMQSQPIRGKSSPENYPTFASSHSAISFFVCVVVERVFWIHVVCKKVPTNKLELSG